MPTPTLSSRALTLWRRFATWTAMVRWFALLSVLFAVLGVVLTFIRPSNDHLYWTALALALVCAVLSIREE